MNFELPNIKRCCFCIPLRYGLLGWAYFKLIWCLVLLLTILFFAKVTNRPLHPVQYAIPLLYCTSLFIEFIITIVFVVGAHKKNPKLLRVYYVYGMVVLGIIILICLLILGFAVYEFFANLSYTFILQNAYETSIFGGGVILFNLYLLALVRSEIIKLENNTQFSFQNNQCEPTCTMEKVEIWCLVVLVTIIFLIDISIRQDSLLEYLIPLLYCPSILVEFVITIVFIIGAHKKNPKLLRVYYIYGTVCLGIMLVICLLLLGVAIYEYFANLRFTFVLHNYNEITIFGGGVILFNLYLLALVRSEIIKLENNTQFSFRNNKCEPTCTMEKMTV